MKYFDDIRLVGGARMPGCRGIVTGRWPGFYSLQFDRRGDLFYQVDDGEVHSFSAPVIYLTHPARSYRFGPRDEGVWDHSWIGFTGPRACRIFEEGFYLLAPRGYIFPARPLLYAELIDRMIDVYRRARVDRHFEAVICLEQLLGMFMEDAIEQAARSAQWQALRDLADAMQADPFETWDFQHEAKKMGLSHSHFRRRFRDVVGYPPHAYLLFCRMQRAADLLRDSGLTVKEVAALCGYSDLAQFSKTFKSQ
ncbi:MAG: AraC family transcriptional regulator, partial [Lentisphaerae bacterium]